jgi:hypothetical protein
MEGGVFSVVADRSHRRIIIPVEIAVDHFFSSQYGHGPPS